MRDQADVAAGATHAGAADVDLERSVIGQFLLHVVKLRVLENQHGVRVGQRRREHEARVLHRGRAQHAQARHMGVPALEAVRMLRRHLASGTGRHADHQRHRKLPARHVAQHGRSVDDRIQRQQAEVDRHHFHDRAHAAECCANAGADKAEFGQGRIADALGPEFIEQTLGHSVGAAVATDILAHQEDPGIVLHCLTQGFAHGLAVADLPAH